MLQPVRVHHGECPYLPNREWIADIVPAQYFDEASYEKLIESGVRRSGKHLYRNACPGCNQCIPLRVSTSRFRPSRSQKRVLTRNQDLRIKIGPVTDDREVIELYERYTHRWHGHTRPVTVDNYRAFLGESPFEQALMRYYLDSELVGAGWVDVLPEGLSSVYFAFHPDYAQRRLGTFSIMQEVYWARTLGKPWLHLGFWVPGGKSMDYKSGFKPHEIAPAEQWEPGLPEAHMQKPEAGQEPEREGQRERGLEPGS